MKYRRDVDGLRAVAVCAVLLMHGFHSVFPNGYLGVDVFFVISGFVITGSLLKAIDLRISDFISGFYSRRFLRLLPALIVVLIATAVMISLLTPRPNEFLKTAVAASFGFANVQLFFAQQDYFAPTSELNPFTHMWSLGVEEQFYILFPLVLWGVNRFLGLQWCFNVNLILLAVSFFSWVWGRLSYPDAAFYLVPFRFWELAAGCLVALWFEMRLRENTGEALDNRMPLSGEYGAFAFLVAVFLLLVPLELPALPVTFLVVACTVIVLFAGVSKTTVGGLLTSSLVNAVGRASYSIYLWHWPILVLATWSVGSGPILTTFLLCLSVFFGFITLVLVENPVRFGFRPRKKVIIASGASLMILGAIVPVGIAFLRLELYLGEPPQMVSLGASSLIDPYEDEKRGAWGGEACVLSANSQVGKKIDVSRCTIGNADAAKNRILVLGNSYSAAFVRAFPIVAEDMGALITVTSSWGASPVGSMVNHSSWSHANDYYWEDVVPELTSRLVEGDHVFLLSDLNDFSDVSGGVPAGDPTELAEGIRRFSSEMAELGVKVSILGPLPFARDSQCDPAMAVPQWYAPQGGPCIYFSYEETVGAQSALRAMLSGLEAENIISVINLDPVFCPDRVCSFFGKDGIILYRDEYSHPSVEAAIASAPLISAGLMRSSGHEGRSFEKVQFCSSCID